MQLFSGRARTLESVVGMLILLVMVATAAGIYIVSQNYNMARFGIASGSGQESGGDFLPVGKAETYNNDNLYEKIDGKAPMYQEAGFVKLTAQRFAAKSNSELGFELYVYDMNNAKNAFSVYSRQKRADATDLNDLGVSAFGYVAGNEICISLGRNYIEMIGSAESNELVDGMEGIAKDLSAKFKPTDNDKIVELGYFPPQGTVAGSWKLQIDNAFGFDGLTDAYSATNIAEVEVNTRTGEVRVLKLTAALDVGKAINRIAVEGQIEGGVVQGIGYALYEEIIRDRGAIKNPQFSTYIIPTVAEMPEIVPIIVEHPYPRGPFGANPDQRAN